MKKYLFFGICLLPFRSFAQLDLIHPGMTLNEFHAAFPVAVPDIDAMTDRIYSKDTLIGKAGEGIYTFVHDTLHSYSFRSEAVPGPSAEFPKADSMPLHRLVSVANQLDGHYADMFGPSSEEFIHPAITSSTVYEARWKRNDAEIDIAVHSETTLENEINAPVNQSKKPKGTYYVLEVKASGSWNKLRAEFMIGSTAQQFCLLVPRLASQVKIFPDCWMLHDTLKGQDADWRFWFEERELSGFSYDTFNGSAYGKENGSVYPVLLQKAKQLETEAEKQFGKTSDLQVPASNEYNLAKRPNAFFYDDVYYNAEWKMEKDKTFYIRLHESGGKGTSFLHLEVYFGKKED